MPLANGEAVEPQVLGEYRSVDDVTQSVGGTLLLAGHGVRVMCYQREQ